MSEKLLPCPFCGSSYVEYVDAGQWKNIHCVSCGGDGAVDLGESGATDSWNHRAYPPEVQAVMDAAKKYISTLDEDEKFDCYIDLVQKTIALEEMETK